MSGSHKPLPQSPELALLSNAFIKLCDEAGWHSFFKIANKLKLSPPTIATMAKGQSFPLPATLLHRNVHKTLAKHAPKTWADPATGGIINNYIEKGQLPSAPKPTPAHIDSESYVLSKEPSNYKTAQTTRFGCPPPGGPVCQSLCTLFLSLCAEAGWNTKLAQSKHIPIYYQALYGIHAGTHFPSPNTLKKSDVIEIFAKEAPQAWENPSIGGILYEYIERGNLPAVDAIEQQRNSIEEPRFDRDGLPPELSHEETAPYGLDPFAAPVESYAIDCPAMPMTPATLKQQRPTQRTLTTPTRMEQKIPSLDFKQAQEVLCDNLYEPLDGQKNYRNTALCLKDVLKTHLDQTPSTGQDWKLWHSLLRYMEEKSVIPKPSLLLLLGLPEVLAAPYNINTPQVPLLIDYVFPDIDRKQAALRKLAIDIHHKVGAAQNQAYPSKPTPLMGSLPPKTNQRT